MINLKHKIRAIIFDMDGTIIKTEQVWDKVVLELLKEKGFIEIPADKLAVYHSLAGMSLHNASAILKELFTLPDSVEELTRHQVEIANRFFAERVNFIGGFETFHQILREHNIPTAIATNAYPANLASIDKSLNLKQFFGNHLYCVGDVEFVGKPDPRLFQHAAFQLGVKPEECIVFEDSIHGFNAALAAGMKCIAIKNERNLHLLDNVNHAIDHYDEAIEALNKILL